MAAWTLPHRITEWCENLTTTLDRRSRKYFLTIVLGIVLATGRRQRCQAPFIDRVGLVL